MVALSAVQSAVVSVRHSELQTVEYSAAQTGLEKVLKLADQMAFEMVDMSVSSSAAMSVDR